MKKTFADTFYIVAPVNKRDEFHEKANEFMLEYDDRPLLTTDAVLLEVGNSRARKNIEKSVEIIEEFLSDAEIEIVRLDESLFNRAFELCKNNADKFWGGG